MPVWIDTLFKGFVTGMGGDPEARHDPAAAWGRLTDMGVRLIQTDAGDALLRYRERTYSATHGTQTNSC